MKKYIPIILVVGFNILYHISTKGTSATVNPFASLIVTYALAIIFCVICFFISSKSKDLLSELKKINWATFVLGLCLTLLEFGNIMMYKVGWNISVGALICSIALAIALLFVGAIFYKDKLTKTTIAGVAVCIAGIVMINL